MISRDTYYHMVMALPLGEDFWYYDLADWDSLDKDGRDAVRKGVQDAIKRGMARMTGRKTVGCARMPVFVREDTVYSPPSAEVPETEIRQGILDLPVGSLVRAEDIEGWSGMTYRQRRRVYEILRGIRYEGFLSKYRTKDRGWVRI